MIYKTNNILGKYIRARREKLLKKDRGYSLRQVAFRIKVEPSYLSKLERGEAIHLSEEKIIALAEDLGEDRDVLLALAGQLRVRSVELGGSEQLGGVAEWLKAAPC